MDKATLKLLRKLATINDLILNEGYPARDLPDRLWEAWELCE